MFKLFSILMILPVLFCGQASASVDLFNGASLVQIYDEGEEVIMSEKELDEFETIFCESISGSRQMPALGVALDEHVKEDMKEGKWIKFVFEKTHIKSEMPFDELLIKVEKDSCGFNIIRGNEGVFEGRCYYLELDGNLNKLYDFIDQLSKKELKSEVELESQEIKETVVVSEELIDEKDEKNKDKPRKNSVIDIKASSDKAVEEDNSFESETVENSENLEESGKSQKELLEVLNHIS